MRRRDVLRGAAGAAALPFASRITAATNQDAYAPLGTVDLPGAKEVVVGDSGDTAYVATTEGFATVDVSDPESPETLFSASSLLADRETGPMTGIYDVKVEGDTLAVVGPANPSRKDRLRGMAVYDVSDPAAPERTGFHETAYAIHNAYLHDGIAYLTALHPEQVYDRETPATNPVVLVDVTGDELEEVGRWSLADHDEGWLDVAYYPRSNHDVYVQDDVLYIAHWDAGTWLVDVSDPANPEHINHFGDYSLEDLRALSPNEQINEGTEKPGNSHYVAVNDDATLLASGAESWDIPETEEMGAPGGIDLWDISDPQSPEKLAVIEGPPTPDPTRGGVWTTSHNFDFDGDRLYTSWYRGGVKVHDVSDPANPEQLAWWRQPEEAMFWTAKSMGDGEAFVASSMRGGEEYGPGLFTFPDRAGEQADAPSLTTTEQATTTAAEETTAATTTSAATTTDSQSGDGGSDGESGGSATGFGVFAAVSGASAAALAAWRRLD
ncbi:LVIVD repeat-containing protein [Halobacterium jilantaiense]|uniref:LVIVD repeat-containing protein n=1 Tax=Halobacterium jilantaiense TaxID=355548 RepID=A0A1I0PB92_9EURY|nr:hypothetical protein [Halobacterium jilantaiense]SEW11636.1 LVIVD repeat-containing protein [Halobacterium jilantaiense]